MIFKQWKKYLFLRYILTRMTTTKKGIELFTKMIENFKQTDEKSKIISSFRINDIAHKINFRSISYSALYSKYPIVYC